MKSDGFRARDLSDAALWEQCGWEAFRGSGPGGQKRNKTSSAVRVTHLPTGIAAVSSESRSQASNKKAAFERMRLQLTLQLRAPIEASKQLDPHNSPKNGFLKQVLTQSEYLAELGRLLDLLESAGWRVSDVAEALGTTSSQLVGFLFKNEAVRAAVNQRRAELGLRALTGA